VCAHGKPDAIKLFISISSRFVNALDELNRYMEDNAAPRNSAKSATAMRRTAERVNAWRDAMQKLVLPTWATEHFYFRGRHNNFTAEVWREWREAARVLLPGGTLFIEVVQWLKHKQVQFPCIEDLEECSPSPMLIRCAKQLHNALNIPYIYIM